MSQSSAHGLPRSLSRAVGWIVALVSRFMKYQYSNNYVIWFYLRNRRARAHWRKHPIEASPAVTAAVEALKRTGICSFDFREVLSAELLTEYVDSAEEAISSPSCQRLIEEAERMVRSADQGARAQSYQVKLWKHLGDRFRERLVQLALREEFLAVASGYMGMSCSLSYVDLWYNVPLPGTDVLFQRWHRDAGDRAIVKLYLYLRDVDESAGPLSYVLGSHADGRHRNVFPGWGSTRTDEVEARFPPEERVVCTGEAGTVVFCDTSGLHKGGHVVSKHRLIFYALYTSDVGRPTGTAYLYDRFLSQPSESLGPTQKYALNQGG